MYANSLQVTQSSILCTFINPVILSTSPIDPWSSIALVSNLPSHIHPDRDDTVEDLSGLGCCGSFQEAWLVLYTLGIKLRYRQQDAVLLNTYLLPHFVDWNIGDRVTRHSMSFFNHQDVWDWVKNEYERRKEQHGERNIRNPQTPRGEYSPSNPHP